METDNACVLCDEPITNPVCPACLQEGVVQWLGEQGHTRLAHDVRALGDGADAENGVACIKCNGHMMLCTYCFTRDVFDLLKHEQGLAKAYLSLFSFDLEHQGWEKQALLELGDVW